MQENFIGSQARQFAKIVHHSASDYENLNSLRERLEKELQPYDKENKLAFLNLWKKELDILFYDHLQKCKKFSDCPQHKTSNNANFIISQFNRTKMHNNYSSFELQKDQYDLNYYFNASNIPNQELVFQTYDYFDKGEGSEFFDALEFLNILNWYYRFLNENVTKPFDVLNQFQNIAIASSKRHILIGFILKWFGGYPVNNLNTQYNTTLRLLESDYLDEIERTKKWIQTCEHQVLSGEKLSTSEEGEKNEFKSYLNFLLEFDKLVNNNPSNYKSKTDEKKSLSVTDIVANEDIISKRYSDLFFFISHSSKDKLLVDSFVNKILILGLGYSYEKIFCTSIEGMGINTGKDFREEIRDKMISAKVIILMVSKDYKTSEICLNEMGAAWVLKKDVIPILLPSVTYNQVGALNITDHLDKIDVDSSLDNIAHSIKELLNFPGSIDVRKWSKHKKEFLQSFS